MNLLKGRLQPFSSAAGEVVESVAYTISRSQAVLTVQYELYGEQLHKLVLPGQKAAAPGKRRDGLWHHSCFELFLKERGPGSGSYFECNFSPSGDWNVYELQGYRQGLCETSGTLRPIVQSRRTENYYTLHVQLDSSVFMSDISAVDIGICCVIEDAQGKLSYWALSHHGRRPDFHDERSFELHL